MTRLPKDDDDYGPTGLDTSSDLWYSSDEDTDEESDDSSCVIISQEALSMANEVGGDDEESRLKMEVEPAEKT